MWSEMQYVSRLGKAVVIGAVALAAATAHAQTPKAEVYMDGNGTECTVRYKGERTETTCKERRTLESQGLEAYFIDGRFVGFRNGFPKKIGNMEQMHYETVLTEPMPRLKSLAEDMGEKYQVVPADDERIKKESDHAKRMLETVKPENCAYGDCKK